MKAILTCLLLASTAAFGQLADPPIHKSPPRPAVAPTASAPRAAPEATLKPGGAVKLEPLTAAKWLQGEAPKSFEPGKVYLLECWATWCGPCVAAIPHVNELHKKFAAKGLRVLGINVWEDGEDKVAKFVKDKGDGMSYPVAYTGRGSAFETEWLKAAGVNGIPHAFVVKDGKLLLMTHPAELTDKVIEALLSGDEGATRIATELNAAKANREKAATTITAFRQAAIAKDTATMAAKLAEMEQTDPKNTWVLPMHLDLLVANKDWPAATKMVAELPEGPPRQIALMTTSRNIVSAPDGEYPADFIKAVSKPYRALIEQAQGRVNAMGLLTLASLDWKAGDKEAAITDAKKAAEIATNPPANPSASAAPPPIPAAPFERFVKSLQQDKLPSMQEFSTWIREAMPKPAAPGNPATPASGTTATPAPLQPAPAQPAPAKP